MCLDINICHWQLQNQYVEINGAFLVSCFKLTPDVKGLIQFSGSQRCLALRIFISPTFLKTMSFSLSVQALNGGKLIEIPDVVVVDNIPDKPNVVPQN